MILKLVFLLAAVAAISELANGLDEKSAKEQPCFDLTNKTVPLDLNWVGTLSTLYYPFSSRLDLYRSATNLLQKDINEISESSLYYDSCIAWNLYTNGSIISRGFGGSVTEYKSKVLTPNMEKFELSSEEKINPYVGLKYTTLTDNKTFLLTPFCMADGEMSWGLGSIYPTLPKETVDKVKEHVISLGFNKEYFTELRYDNCNVS